ncbi:hypothetical protein [Paracidovorax wautersii]|uniref:hypothetical protein n=1 Tax=Paracidovorax wautersii TaxID=1177982 RepID=UPI0031D37838
MTDSTAPQAPAQLAAFDLALQGLQQGTLAPHTFSAQMRDLSALRQALPPRYDEVLLGLLDRLESSALFAEESCSFSQQDLIGSLRMWAGKAAGVLNA